MSWNTGMEGLQGNEAGTAGLSGEPVPGSSWALRGRMENHSQLVGLEQQPSDLKRGRSTRKGGQRPRVTHLPGRAGTEPQPGRQAGGASAAEWRILSVVGRTHAAILIHGEKENVNTPKLKIGNVFPLQQRQPSLFYTKPFTEKTRNAGQCFFSWECLGKHKKVPKQGYIHRILYHQRLGLPLECKVGLMFKI